MSQMRAILLKPRHPSVRDVGDGNLHIIHEGDVMLTITEDRDVPDEDDIFSFRSHSQVILKGFVEHLCNLVIGIIHSLKNFFVHSCHPVWRLF